MKKLSRFAPWTGLLGVALLVLGGVAMCLFFGLIAAVMPPGTIVRLLIVPLALGAAILLWIMPKRKQSPDDTMNLLLFGLIALVNLWPQYIVYRFGGLPSLNPTKLAWLLLLVVAGYSILSSTAPMARLVARCKAHPWLMLSILFLLLWRIISAGFGVQPLAQIFSLANEIVGCYVIFIVALAVLRDERDVFRLLAVLVAVALLQSLLASYESVVKHTLFNKFITVSSEDSVNMLDTVREKFRNGHYRAQGTFEHPMVLAEFMAMTAPIAMALFLKKGAGYLRWFAAGFIPLALLVIVSSRSRVGIAVLLMAILLVGVLMLLPRGKHAHTSSLSLVLTLFMLPVLLIAGYLAMNEVLTLIAGRSVGEANSTMTRVLMMERGIPLLQSSPLVGYGNGMGPVKLGFYDGTRFNIDNYWLGIALDSGLPGLAAFLFSFAAAMLVGFRCYRERSDAAGLAAGFLAVSLVILLGCKTVLSISSGFTLGYILIAAIVVLKETPGGLPQAQQQPTLVRGQA